MAKAAGLGLRQAARDIPWQVLLAVIVLGGAAFRLHGLDWDQPEDANVPLQMHPDERFLSLVAARIAFPDSPGAYFDTAQSPLNPYNAPETPSFVYGTFPLFLAKGVATVAEHDLGPLSWTARVFCAGDGYDTTVVCGRRLTALADTATIALVFLLASLIFGRAAGLAASALYAMAVLPIQLSHFWASDPWVVCFGTALACASVGLVRSRGPSGPPGRAGFTGRQLGLSLLIGLLLGLAVASKVSAFLLLAAPVAAVALRIAGRDCARLGLRWRGAPLAAGGHWTADLTLLWIAFIVALVTFRLAQPYAFVGPAIWDIGVNRYWWDDIFERELKAQNGAADIPYLVQWAGRSPYLWPLQNMVLWGLGPALGLWGWLAAAVATLLVFKRREMAFVIPLLVIAAYFGFHGGRFVAYMRYFAPLYPMLCVLAGWAVVAAWSHGPRLADRFARALERRRWGARLALATGPRLTAARTVVIVALFAATAWWALAYTSIFFEKHPRVAASEWIFANLPQGTSITGEIWDDTIPYYLPGKDAGAYRLVELGPYDTDSVQKVQEFIFGRAGPNASPGLQGADYIAVTSARVKDSVPRLEREYPAMIRYYELLESGELGFDLAAQFEVRPGFLGLRIDDASAEESFTVYDHPEVWIYRKTARWDAGRAYQLLLDARPERAVNLLPNQGRTNGLQFTPDEARVQQQGGTWSDIFDPDGLTSHAPWLWWLLWLEVAAFATVPWVTWLFRALPDRGYGLSKLAGFAATGLLAWVLVAWDVAHFSATVAWAALALLVVAGAVTGWLRRRTLGGELRERWASIVTVEAIFLTVFAAFLLIRYANPDLWHHPQGGEKPVEFAFLQAVTRSTTLPPYDPWFANGTMNYYYMGWWMLAVPIRALRIVPEIAFNLGIPTYAALAATVVYSAASGMAGLAQRGSARAAIVTGLLAVVLFIGIGNIDSAHQAIQRYQSLNVAGFDGQKIVYDWDLWSGTPFFGGLVGFLSGFKQWLFDGQPLPPFDWWRASRVHNPQYDITEFPYWTFLFGDLHAHMMGLPFFGLVIVSGLAYAATAAQGMRRHAWAVAALLGIALGLVRTVHTWDFYTAGLLVGAALLGGQLLAPGRWQRRWWDGAGHAVLAIAVLTVVFAPYTQRFEVFESGIVRARETTALNQWSAHFGLFAIITLTFLAVRYVEEIRARGRNPGRNPFLALVAGPWEVGSLVTFLVGLSAFTWRFGLTTVALGFIVLLFLANLLWLEWRARDRDLPRLVTTVLLAAGIGVSVGVEVVQAEYDIVRMNTIFKFYLQAWQLYAIGCALACWQIGRAVWEADGWRVVPRPRLGGWATLLATAASILLVASMLYLWSGTKERQRARFAALPATLDGLAYLDVARFHEDKGTLDIATDDREFALADDEPLIRWLREEVAGSPVIVEAVGPLYHWTGRMSWNTGLPAVIGWDWHEVAYRTAYDFLVQQRRAETQRFYIDPNPAFARSYLRKYDVRYVVVGTEELVFGSEPGLAKFGTMPELRVAFESGPYRIYEVIQP